MINKMNNLIIGFTIIFLFANKIYPQLEMKKTELDFAPEWAKKVVWYQIFPERFNNGDKFNDPQLESIKGSWPHDFTSEWQIHPWTSDWYELQPYEKKNGKDIWFNIQRRRYGGDLQGIIDKLDYLKDLGIGAIYLNPVFEAPSHHKYDGATYHHIDPHFGPDPENDKEIILGEIPDNPSTWIWTAADKLFLKLINETHSRGIKIIIDGVFNHMGINSWAFKDVFKNQKNSKYKDWFTVKSWNDTQANTKFDYEGWFGVKELPELREDENGIVDGPKQYIYNITKRWMDPNGDGNPEDGIDGWRLDVAFCVKHQFWKDWRILVKSLNPDAYLTAEIVDSPEANVPYLLGDEFDAVMNYNFLFLTAEYFIDDKTSISTSEFDEGLKKLRDAYPDCVTYAMQNLFGSHDTQRVLSHIVNREIYKIRNWGETFDKWKASNPKYDFSKPKQDDIQILKLMIIFQMTYIGAPYIYYGDEAGMWGANDPCTRKPMVWPELKYENEKSNPDQSLKEAEDIVQFDYEIFNHFKKLISIRNENTALQSGDFKTLLVDNQNGLYAYSRAKDDQEIIIVLNNSIEEKSIRIQSNTTSDFLDVLNNQEIEPIANGYLDLKITGKWAAILVNKASPNKLK